MTLKSAGNKVYEASGVNKVIFIKNLVEYLGDPKKLVLHYWLNEGVNAQNCAVFAAVLNEEEIVIKQVGNELVVG